MVPSQSFPQTIVINEAAPNNVTAVGSLSEGATIVQPADQSSGVLVLPRGAGVNTYKDEFVRGKISSWNVSAQKALGTRMSATVAYVANRQNGMLRNRNVNYGTLGGGAASQPFFPLGHQLGDEHLHGRRQGEVRLAAVEHEPPHERWRPVHRGVYVREDD